MITILTPTYNRAYTLKNAYESLIRQTNKEFEWVIVDDGSIDNTKDLVNDFIKEGIIKIKYFQKKNGGKHTALNYGIKKINSKYVLILDSDDYLKDNCVELVLKTWEKYDKDKSIGCLSFLRVFPNDETIGKKYTENEIISNHIDFRFNKSLLGDMCEVFRSSVLKKYPFPVFEGEKFLSEAIVWNRIAFVYNTVYVNKPIYVTDYLEDGLSKNSLRVRYNSPNGASLNANMFLDPRFKLSIRLKNALLYDGFSIISGKKFVSIIKESNNKFLALLFFPLGIVFYMWLKIKFRELKK